MPKAMEAITKKIRTPEEIVAWFNAARQRKAAWEKETKAELRSIVEAEPAEVNPSKWASRFVGVWKDSRTADEIVNDIRDARTRLMD